MSVIIEAGSQDPAPNSWYHPPEVSSHVHCVPPLSGIKAQILLSETITVYTVGVWVRQIPSVWSGCEAVTICMVGVWDCYHLYGRGVRLLPSVWSVCETYHLYGRGVRLTICMVGGWDLPSVWSGCETYHLYGRGVRLLPSVRSRCETVTICMVGVWDLPSVGSGCETYHLYGRGVRLLPSVWSGCETVTICMVGVWDLPSVWSWTICQHYLSDSADYVWLMSFKCRPVIYTQHVFFLCPNYTGCGDPSKAFTETKILTLLRLLSVWQMTIRKAKWSVGETFEQVWCRVHFGQKIY